MQTSNTANLRRTDRQAFRKTGVDGRATIDASEHLVTRAIIACILMLAVWVSFHPFAAELEDTTGGDIVNQLGFGFLLILCLFTLATLIEQRLVTRLVTPSYLLLAMVLIGAIVVSSAIDASFRAMVFSIIVVLAALLVMTLPRNIRQFAVIIAIGCLLALTFSYVAIFAFPASGVHPFGGVESQHGGLWRGIYDHKNIASAVMAVFVMIGVFTWREGYRLLGFVVTVLALVFLFNAGSKTSATLLPVAMLYAAFVSRLKTPYLRFIASLVPLGVLFTITVGSAVIPQINGVLQMIAPGTTFTGRLDLWQYTVERIWEHPFVGYGFENFWDTPIVTNADQPIELTWDVREIVHGHNSYLDAAISFGLPGLMVIMFVLIILPAMDFAAANWQGTSSRLANLFLSIWLFTSLNACLESFFFRRSDPVWFCMLLAVIGLRLLATGRSKPVMP